MAGARIGGQHNASILGAGVFATAPCKNTSAAALPIGGPVEWETTEYDGISVHESTGLLSEVAGVIVNQAIPVDAPGLDGERSSHLAVSGVVAANVLGAATVDQGTFLKPTSGEKYFSHSETPTRFVSLTDLTAESTEQTWDSDNAPKVLILPDDTDYHSDVFHLLDVSTAFDFYAVNHRAIKVHGLMTVIEGVIATAPAVVNLEKVDGTEVFLCTTADSGSAAGDVASDFLAALAANALFAADTPYRITGTGASTNTIAVTIRVIYSYQ